MWCDEVKSKHKNGIAEDEEAQGMKFEQVVQQKVSHGGALKSLANIRWYLEADREKCFEMLNSA